MISSPRSKSIQFCPKGTPADFAKADKATLATNKTIFDAVNNAVNKLGSAVPKDVGLQLKNREAVTEIMALPPPNENYQLPVELKTIFREVMAAPISTRHINPPKKQPASAKD